MAVGQGRELRLVAQAKRLGREHGAAGLEPFGDMDAGGEALLMDALGETGPTTAANHGARSVMVDTYLTGWDEGAES